MSEADPRFLKTVGELRAFLAEYPDDMPVFATWEGQMELLRKDTTSVDKYGRAGEEVDTLVIDVDKP